MKIIQKLKYIFTRQQKIKFIIILILTFGGAAVETLGVTMIMPLISVATDPSYIFQQPIMAYVYNLLSLESVNHFLILLTILLIAVYVIKTLYLFVMYKLQYRFVYNNQMRLSAKLMDCYMKKSYEYHSNKNSSEIIQGVTQDVTRLFQLVMGVVSLITEVMVIMCIGVILIIIDPVMVILIVVLLTGVMLALMRFYRKSLVNAGVANQRSYREMIKWISQGIGGIKEIKVVGREQHFVDEYSHAATKYAEAQRKYSFLSQAPRLFIESICICTVLVVFSIILYSGTDTSLMIPQLSIFAMAAFRIMPSFNRINSYYNTVIFNLPSINLVYRELKDSEYDKDTATEESSKGVDMTFLPEISIEVKNLFYRYPNTENDILHDAELKIPIKKSIAIIGTSGAGKTTFADIFLGLLKPTGGEITVNGVNIHKNSKEWSKKLGYIPQTIYLCDDSIRKNVAFGVDEAEINDERVTIALEKAQLGEFIKTLPKGVNTEIGERGVRLSGGQRQRIGIARAFYHDPEIFVLDEATSALDNDTEAAVMEAINAIKDEKTLIIIAHRLSTIQNCELVYQIENGKVTLRTNTFSLNGGGM